MRLRFKILLLLWLAMPASAAITDKYVASAAAGDGTGSSAANAMSFTDFVDYMSTGGSFTATAGDRFNIVVGTYARTTTTDAWANGGTITSPVIVRGYSSVITDGYQGRTNSNGALVTTNMPLITYTTGRLNCSGTWIILESLNITCGSAGSPDAAAVTCGTDTSMYGCSVTMASTGTSASVLAAGARGNYVNCDLTATAGASSCRGIGGASYRVIGCRIKVVGGVGVDPQSAAVVIGNVIYGCLNGIKSTSTGAVPVIAYNTIVGNTNDGINVITGTTDLQSIFGNLITDNGTYGINGVSAANAIFAGFNRLDRNTTANVNSATDSLAATSYGHNTTSATQGNEYSSYAGNDYRLLSGSPAKGAGHFSFMDIGALQRQEAGGATVIGPSGVFAP